MIAQLPMFLRLDGRSRPAKNTSTRTSAKPRTTGNKNSNRQPQKRGTKNGQRDQSRELVQTCLVGAAVILSLLGLVMVYSATSVELIHRDTSSLAGFSRQTMWLIMGTIAAVFLARRPITFWRKAAGPALILALGAQFYVALGAVSSSVFGLDLPLVIGRNGAVRWIGAGPLSAQPSEFIKLALILWLGVYLERRQHYVARGDGWRPVVVVTGSILALVMCGNDLGTSVIIALICGAMYFMSGAPFRHIVTALAVGSSAFILSLFVQGGFRIRRITAFMDGTSYQLNNSKIGFANGGLLGNGPGSSKVKWGYLPEAETDFILSVIGEELGLIGTLLVIGAFVVLAAGGIVTAYRSTTIFGRLVAVGATVWIFLQAIMNIGVAVGAFPTKGIPLPFVSSGGSSLFMCLVAVALLVSVLWDDSKPITPDPLRKPRMNPRPSRLGG